MHDEYNENVALLQQFNPYRSCMGLCCPPHAVRRACLCNKLRQKRRHKAPTAVVDESSCSNILRSNAYRKSTDDATEYSAGLGQSSTNNQRAKAKVGWREFGVEVITAAVVELAILRRSLRNSPPQVGSGNVDHILSLQTLDRSMRGPQYLVSRPILEQFVTHVHSKLRELATFQIPGCASHVEGGEISRTI